MRLTKWWGILLISSLVGLVAPSSTFFRILAISLEIVNVHPSPEWNPQQRFQLAAIDSISWQYSTFLSLLRLGTGSQRQVIGLTSQDDDLSSSSSHTSHTAL
jgi:hypothetical protein